MNIIILADPGCEQACANELERVTGAVGTPSSGVLLCDLDAQTACDFVFKTQTALRVLVELDLENPEKELFGSTYRIVCSDEERVSEIATALGAIVPVDLTNPDTVVYAQDDIVGVDLGGELWKRDWRVMLSRKSLRSTVAASAAIYAGLSGAIVDPFGDDGTLAIEATLLLTGKSPRAFEKRFPFQKIPLCKDIVVSDTPKSTEPIHVFTQDLRDVKAVRTNAKLAGCSVEVTKLPVEWLHTKVERVQNILTYPPSSGKSIPPKKVVPDLEEFFRQASEVLEPDGSITCVTAKLDELVAAASGFEQGATHEVRMGKQPMHIVTFTVQR